MFSWLQGTMVSNVLGPLEKYLSEHARDIIKPKVLMAYPSMMGWFARVAAEKGVTTISVPTKDRTLTAHQLQWPGVKEVKKDDEEVSTKKAIVYVTGNCHYVANAFLEKTEELLKIIAKETEKLGEKATISCFCQDYRGRGYNKSAEKEDENFNNYTLLQDAKDQAALLAYLVKQGYKPENILIIGYSFGSAVGLWALHYLIETEGQQYANIKLYSDRGFGNLFAHPWVKPLVLSQKRAHEELHSKEMVPEIPLHDIAASLPNSFIMCVENDRNICADISLANTIQEKEVYGRVYVGKANNDKLYNPHFAEHEMLFLAAVPELKSWHFMVAILNEFQIKINLTTATQDFVSSKGYFLKQDAKPGEDDYVALSLKLAEAKEEEITQANSISITTNAPANLLAQLHDYCCDRSQRAANSGLGKDYNHAPLSKVDVIGWTWTAKQQVEMAVRIMENLYKYDSAAIKLIAKEQGPHHSGGLKIIFSDVMRLIETLEKLQEFNAWIVSMNTNRHKMSAPEVFTDEDDCVVVRGGYFPGKQGYV